MDKFPREKKELISIRLEPKVLNWFREENPRGYQTSINSVLAKYVESQMQSKIRCAGRAQELFRRFYPQCFWHYDRDLQITPANIHLVIEGLRKHGGREGYLLASELCQ